MKRWALAAFLFLPAGLRAAYLRTDAPDLKTSQGAGSVSENIRETRDILLNHKHKGNDGSSVLDNTVPVGAMTLYVSTTPPAGWLSCDGTSYSTTTYSALFAVIGYVYGGAGANFSVPDIRGRAPIGTGTGSGLTARSMAATVGEETHVLTVSEMPAHSHQERGRIGASGGANIAARLDGSGDTVQDNSYNTTLSVGGDGAHNNMQPSLVVNFIIYAGP